ncbi:MAG: outer membrane beta-barrel protein [Gammaproteobacteria bacterium]
MKRLTTLCAALAVSTCPLLLHADPFNPDIWSPHIGVDYNYIGGSGIGNYEVIFPDVTDGVGGYVGVRFLKHYNIDIGYERSFDFHRFTEFTAVSGSSSYFGDPDNQGDAVNVNFRMKDIYLHLSYHYPFAKCFEAFVMLGLARAEAETTIAYRLAGVTREILPTVNTEWFARWGIGVQYNFMKHLGIRAMVHREPLSRFEWTGENQLQHPYILKQAYRGANVFKIGFVAFV